MTTGAFRGEIYMTPLHSPGPKMGAGENSVQLSFAGTELYRFEVPIGGNANFFKILRKIGEGVIRILFQTN